MYCEQSGVRVMHTSAIIVSFTDSQPNQWLSTKLTVNHYNAPMQLLFPLLTVNLTSGYQLN